MPQTIENVKRVLHENPDLHCYRVSIHEEKGDTDFTLLFDCFAEDDDHAAEQAEDAYPNCEVIHTFPVDIEDYIG